MITREGKDEWSLTHSGKSEPYLHLTTAELEARLRKSGLWPEEALARLLAFEIGESTKPPLAYYVRGEIAYASKNGDIDLTRPLGLVDEKSCLIEGTKAEAEALTKKQKGGK